MKLLKALRREIKRAKRDRKRAERKRRRYYAGYRDGLRRAMVMVAESPMLHGLVFDIKRAAPAPPLEVQSKLSWSGGDGESDPADNSDKAAAEPSSGMVFEFDAELPDASRYPHMSVAKVNSGPDAGVYVNQKRVVAAADVDAVRHETPGMLEEATPDELYRAMPFRERQMRAIEISIRGAREDQSAHEGLRQPEVALARACLELSVSCEHEYEWEALADAIGRLPGYITVADIRRAWGDMGERADSTTSGEDEVFDAYPLPGVFDVKDVPVDEDANRVEEILGKVHAEREAADLAWQQELTNRETIKRAEVLESQARVLRERVKENSNDD